MNDISIEEFIDIDKVYDGVRAATLPSPDEEELSKYHTITPEQFAEFERYLVIDILKGLRYGQAFCERFGISNASPLYHFRGREISERWIRENYLVKNETKIH
jgi:hypothetical protein